MLMPRAVPADKDVEGILMRFVRVQYDASDRQFKLMDHDLASQAEDGQMYLIAEPSLDDFAPAEDLQLELPLVKPAAKR
jgi:hypothetical protein